MMGLETTPGDQAAGKTNPAGRPSPLTLWTRGGRWGITRLVKEGEEWRLRGCRVGRLAGWTPGGEVPKKPLANKTHADRRIQIACEDPKPEIISFFSSNVVGDGKKSSVYNSWKKRGDSSKQLNMNENGKHNFSGKN